MKNWQKRISIEEKLDLIRQLEKGEQIIDIRSNVDRTEGSAQCLHNIQC